MVYTPTNWGLPFLLVVGLGGAVYFGGGYLHGKRTRGARGVQALPHAQHWLALHGLVSDGLALVRGGRGGRGYERVAAGTQGPKQKGGKAGKGKGKKEKGSGKERSGNEKDGKAASGKQRGSDRREAAPAPAPAPAPAAAPSAAAGTAAGDGGRWVHVPG